MRCADYTLTGQSYRVLHYYYYYYYYYYYGCTADYYYSCTIPLQLYGSSSRRVPFE